MELAVRAHVRHEHTPYDELLGRGVDRSEAARAFATASRPFSRDGPAPADR